MKKDDASRITVFEVVAWVVAIVLGVGPMIAIILD